MDTLEITYLDGERGLRLAGELDMQTAPRLEEALAGMQGGGQPRLDLSQLTFIDSSGLRAITAFARAENGHGRLILDGVSEMMFRIFEVTDLTEHPGLEVRLRTDGD